MIPNLTDLRKNFDLVLVIALALVAYMLIKRYTRFRLGAPL